MKKKIKYVTAVVDVYKINKNRDGTELICTRVKLKIIFVAINKCEKKIKKQQTQITITKSKFKIKYLKYRNDRDNAFFFKFGFINYFFWL